MLLKTLYDLYDKFEKNNMIDNKNNDNCILPIYHNSIKSSDKNIINIIIDNNLNILDINFLEENKILIYPVTLKSLVRTSDISPHMLIDNHHYMLNTDNKKNKCYKEQLLHFVNYAKVNADDDINNFLTIFNNFVNQSDMIDKIKNKININFDLIKKKYFLNIMIKQNQLVDNHQILDCSNFKKLHQFYIKYVEDNFITNDGICSVTGNFDKIIYTHRGIIVNAKLISISNHKENYEGRLCAEDVSKIGLRTSEKSHLMLKYLINSENVQRYGNYYFIALLENDLENCLEKLGLNLKDNKILNHYNENDLIQKNPYTYIIILGKFNEGRVSLLYLKKYETKKILENIKNFYKNINILELTRMTSKICNFFHFSFYNNCYSKIRVDILKGIVNNDILIKNKLSHMYKNNLLNINIFEKSDLEIALKVLEIDFKKENYFEKNRSYIYGKLFAYYYNYNFKDKYDISKNTKNKILLSKYKNFILNPYKSIIDFKKTYGFYTPEHKTLFEEIEKMGILNNKLDYIFIFGFYHQLKKF